MGYFKVTGGVATPFLQKKKKASYEITEEEHSKEDPYWYKKDGIKITKYIYCKWQKKIPPDVPPSFNLQTNNPDPCDLKKKREEERKKNFPEKKKDE
tara:strand:- start:275 stop:565 length:291 start_codon:yes stop_codon:yes gene_type:complete